MPPTDKTAAVGKPAGRPFDDTKFYRYDDLVELGFFRNWPSVRKLAGELWSAIGAIDRPNAQLDWPRT